jgi:hypothetical protein
LRSAPTPHTFPAVPSTLPDPGTVVLYALSTLAQTCAALAAFVGAVGLFRLQLLRAGQSTAEHDMRGLSGQAAIFPRDVAFWLPVGDIAAGVASADPKQGGFVVAARQAWATWLAFEPRLGCSRRALVIFEGWNLGVIFVSLIGFNHVAWLSSSPWTPGALWLVALGTVGVTGWCVFAWTRE